jgi:hypothetical protein
MLRRTKAYPAQCTQGRPGRCLLSVEILLEDYSFVPVYFVNHKTYNKVRSYFEMR